VIAFNLFVATPSSVYAMPRRTTPTTKTFFKNNFYKNFTYQKPTQWPTIAYDAIND